MCRSRCIGHLASEYFSIYRPPPPVSPSVFDTCYALLFLSLLLLLLLFVFFSKRIVHARNKAEAVCFNIRNTLLRHVFNIKV